MYRYSLCVCSTSHKFFGENVQGGPSSEMKVVNVSRLYDLAMYIVYLKLIPRFLTATLVADHIPCLISTYWSFIATPFPFFRPLLISHHVFIVILCKNLWLFLILFFLHAMLISVIGAQSSVLQLFCLHCFERFFFTEYSLQCLTILLHKLFGFNPVLLHCWVQ